MNKKLYDSLEKTAKLALKENEPYLASTLYGVLAEYVLDGCKEINLITLEIGQIRKNHNQKLTVTEHDSLIN